MDLETAYYIVHHFPRLLKDDEAAVLRYDLAMFKIKTPDAYDSVEAYERKVNFYRKGNNISESPAVLNLLANGVQQFYINAAIRIIEETPNKIYFNNCPSCKKLARTPYAKQCKYCGNSWHDRISANFKVNKVFDLAVKPRLLYFAGNLTSGKVEEGMRLDLTFMGVASKPIIESIGFLDHISEGSAEVTLGVNIASPEDRAYLKKRGVLAIPIIIEKENVS
jgi:hypothetical protein